MVTGSRVNQVDPYAVLGVSRECSQNELKSAFRRLARKYHPDVNPGDKIAEERFKTIHAAYQILIDPYERRTYDFAHPHAGRGSSWQPAPPPPTAADEPRIPVEEFPATAEDASDAKSRAIIVVKSVLAFVGVLGLAVGLSLLFIDLATEVKDYFINPTTGKRLLSPERERANGEVLAIVGCIAAYFAHLVLERTMNRLHEDE